MPTPSRRVQLLVVIALVAVAGLLSAQPASALRIWETFYYSDATLTTQVGYCYDNPCTGESYCTGQLTAYSRDHLVGTCIPPNLPTDSPASLSATSMSVAPSAERAVCR